MALLIERQFVQDTYEIIADRFNITRTYLWKGVKEFLNKVEPYSTVVEIGCGNGKNLLYRNDCINIGFDFCNRFCEICSKKGVESLVANNLSIPMKTNRIDYVMSIAVIHHLYTKERRLNALNELVRILRPGGKLLIQVWALEQPQKSRRKFEKQDNYVGFNNPEKTMNKKRFYHVFKKGELKELIENVHNVKIESLYWEVGNWVAIVKKL